MGYVGLPLGVEFAKRGFSVTGFEIDPAKVKALNRGESHIIDAPKIVGGITDACTRHASALYGAIVDRVVSVSSTECAEMVKLLENPFRAVNIGLVNEVALMCDRLKLDTWEVIDAAASKPF